MLNLSRRERYQIFAALSLWLDSPEPPKARMLEALDTLSIAPLNPAEIEALRRRIDEETTDGQLPSMPHPSLASDATGARLRAKT